MRCGHCFKRAAHLALGAARLYERRSGSGGLAKFTAMRRASSRAAGFVVEVETSERLAGSVFDDEALGCRFLQRPPKSAYLALWPNLSLLATTAETVRCNTTLFELRHLRPSVMT